MQLLLPAARCALTAPFHPYRAASGVGGLLSVALSLGSPPPDVIRHPALWSPDFPPPAKAGGDRSASSGEITPGDDARFVRGSQHLPSSLLLAFERLAGKARASNRRAALCNYYSLAVSTVIVEWRERICRRKILVNALIVREEGAQRVTPHDERSGVNTRLF
jgi:hypothetical protein